jgi:hypothetical protein
MATIARGNKTIISKAEYTTLLLWQEKPAHKVAMAKSRIESTPTLSGKHNMDTQLVPFRQISCSRTPDLKVSPNYIN